MFSTLMLKVNIGTALSGIVDESHRGSCKLLEWRPKASTAPLMEQHCAEDETP